MLFSGKNCLITGANSGLGFAVSRRLARGGAHTILLCQDKVRGENLFVASADAAADNILYVAALVEQEKQSGRAYEKREEKPLTAYWQDREVRKRLWAVTESLIQNRQHYQYDSGRQIAKYSV